MPGDNRDWGQLPGQSSANQPDTFRARSFIERYVVARAAHFRFGKEDEDGWTAILQGMSVYKKIAEAVNGDARRVQQELESLLAQEDHGGMLVPASAAPLTNRVTP